MSTLQPTRHVIASLLMLRSIMTAIGLAAVAACAHSTQPTSREQSQPSRQGDPYILQLVDQIGSAWTVPTTVTDAQLAKLTAVACLTISESGTLSSYEIVRPSGNEEFDRSVDATLYAIKQLPPPPDRDLATPRGPKNLKYLATHGKLCAELSPPAK